MVAALRARAERGDTGWACGRGDLACLSGPLRSSAACGELAAGVWHRLLSGVFKRYRRTRRACSVIVTRPGLFLVSTMTPRWTQCAVEQRSTVLMRIW